ncbi:Cof-type HAD-IIB family hydrolase [Aneurinibacillus aneurinilyticus]|uniref:Cof-like hydrolase n=3 Tax=Aneurinibacillus aneurinilyticus TaxID=1391 RepID=U1XAA1_ANEAE|nr:Cof-type HAD-IIB family hydrolase [Aneurinibacillus aneurinilyticus]ERI11885.1 Cof-like hydrolase [Aneurinibacillus aneurinilyticus ATCC 12856]MED0708635.1 Cof-type HAD-IIB family hydrolase [Aneurinibacillus aneurinilyticus]MED0725568.1 Cof-type HAD-IIB family hydrolase [Aneurinibacillus aneurinilyticus]MED0733050.1 Cof-type HAD-IIB family hydrolase [Aneurinibacillus aneurinilyticus]MED0743823.1 Cof-type HAD-IIB family hydrolase [Aneurinibacillus aneurinilyticus]
MGLIAIDLDGTLLNDQNEISEENIKAIQYAQEQGFEVVISTGRAYFDVRRICEKAGLSTFVIGTNGATIHSKDEKRISATTIEKNHVLSILQWLNERNYYYEVFTDKAIYTIRKERENFYNEIQKIKNADIDADTRELVEIAERQLDQFGYIFVENYHDILQQEEDFYNILVCSLDKKKLEEGCTQFKKFSALTIVSSANHNIEITSKNASKGIALERLVSLTNRSLEQTIAIGDSNNDLSMFQKAKYSVAMGNAKDEIKDACTMTTLKNDENGVAHAIYQYLDKLVIQTQCN